MTTTRNPATHWHAQALAGFDTVIAQVAPEQWTLSTPCSDWDVRALVNHVLSEARWTAPMLAGSTIAEVGDRLDGDLLGADPQAAWQAGRIEADEAVDAVDPDVQIVHLSFGDTVAAEYLRQLTADYLVHSWDLATAIGADDRLDAGVVEAVGGWFTPEMAAAYRGGGAIAGEVSVAEDADPQDRLLARFGRDARAAGRGTASPG